MSNKIRRYIIEDSLESIANRVSPTQIVGESPYANVRNPINKSSLNLDLFLGILSYSVPTSYTAGVNNFFRRDKNWGNIIKSDSVAYPEVTDDGSFLNPPEEYQIVLVWKDWEEKIKSLFEYVGIVGSDVNTLDDLELMENPNPLEKLEELKESLKWHMMDNWDVAMYCPCAAFHWQHYKMSKARDGRLAVKSNGLDFTNPGELRDTGVWRSRHNISYGQPCKHLYYSIQQLYRERRIVEDLIDRQFDEYKKKIQRQWSPTYVEPPVEIPSVKSFTDSPPSEEDDPKEYRDFIVDVLGKRYKKDPRTWDDIAKDYGLVSGEAARKRAYRAYQSVLSKKEKSPYLIKTYKDNRKVKGVKKVEDYFDGDFFRRLFEVINVST